MYMYTNTAKCEPYSEQACRDAATALGLKLGGGGFDFSFKIDNYPIQGCYAYFSGSGQYADTAYYSAGGSVESMKTVLTDNLRYRPQNYDCTGKHNSVCLTTRMDVCLLSYMHIYIYICMHAFIWVCICVYMVVYVYAYVHVYVYVFVYVYVHAYVYLYLYLYLYTYVCMHVCKYVCMYVCMRVCDMYVCACVLLMTPHYCVICLISR